MRIEIDLLAHLKNMRQQFQSKDRWVSEFVQNAQRSKATELRVAISKNTVIIADNGCGCLDPKVLFTIATSDWTGLENETPFGTGFFSTLAVAKKVVVRSRNWQAVMNIEDIFESGTLDVVRVETGLPDFHGFQATLHDVDTTNVAELFSTECQYLKLALSIDGLTVPKKEFAASASNHPTYSKLNIDDELCVGMIYAAQWGKVHTYHNYRQVEDVYCRAEGDLEFKKANPRCPDRTAWLRDDSYTDVQKRLSFYVMQMYLNIWQAGSQGRIKEHGDAIKTLVHPNLLLRDHVFVATDYTRECISILPDELATFKGFWASEKTNISLIQKVWHYKIPVILSKNSVEDHLLQQTTLPQVENFDQYLTREYDIKLYTNRPDIQSLFNKLSELSGFPERLMLAEIKMWLTPKINSERKEFPVLGICAGNVAYVQQSLVHDKLFGDAVASVLVTAAHEVAHLHGLDDGDPKHLEKQLAILEEWMPVVFSVVKNP